MHLKILFFPSTIKEWNNLPVDIRSATSKVSFKHRIISSFNCKALFMCNNIPRKKDVPFSQMRMGFSNLNADLFSHGCTDNQSCSCGYYKENCQHFLLDCPLYDHLRHNTFHLIKQISPRLTQNITTRLLLYGNPSLNNDQNSLLQTYVINFIHDTDRFQWSTTSCCVNINICFIYSFFLFFVWCIVNCLCVLSLCEPVL